MSRCKKTDGVFCSIICANILKINELTLALLQNAVGLKTLITSSFLSSFPPRL